MTYKEQPFLHRTLEAVLAEPEIGQIVLCVEEKSTWVDATLGALKEGGQEPSTVDNQLREVS